MIRLIALFVFALLTPLTSRAAHPFLCCDYGGDKVCVVSAACVIEWQYDCKHPQDCWKLPNGNILFCFVSGALEVTADAAKKVVWEYKAPDKVEVHACQPLPGGNVMIVECGSSRIIEVGRDGKIAKEIKLTTAPEIKLHNQFRGTRKLANGNYRVCFKGEGKIVDIDPSGRVIKSLPVPGDPHGAITLPDGHIIVTCGDGHKVIEFDADGKAVWELNESDLPGNTLRLMAGCHRLPNGNTVFCNYLGHGHLGEQPLFFEVTREKKIVWQFADHTKFKTINQIMVLDVPGDVTKGEVWR